MAERIDELLVGLGLDTDEQSFQRGMSAFAGIRSAALSAAGAIGVSFGAQQVVEFASRLHSASVEAERLQTSVGYLTQLDDAFRQAGASGADATAELGNMVRLMDEFTFNTGGAAFNLAAQVGLEPSAIADAENVMDAYELLIERASRLDPEERRVALESLGFGGGTTALSQAGPDMMSQWMARSAELAGVTDEMVQESIEFNQQLGELSTAIRGLSNEVLSKLLPPLTTIAGFLTDWLGDEGNRKELADLVTKGPAGYLIDPEGSPNREITNRLPDWLRRYDWEPFELSDIPGVPDWRRDSDTSDEGARSAPWSGDLFRDSPDRGADSWIPDIWPETLDAIREMQVGPEDIGGWGGSSPQTTPDGLNADTLDSIRERQQSGEFRPSDMEYLRQQMRNEFPERYQGAANNVTFNINGATDPIETGRIVREEMRQLSRRTAEDYRSSLV